MMKRAHECHQRQTERACLGNECNKHKNLFQHHHRQLCGNSNVPNRLEIIKTFLPLCHPLSFPIFPCSPFQSFLSYFLSFLPSFLPSFFTNCCVCRRSNNTTVGGREVDERQPHAKRKKNKMSFQISANHQP